MSNKKTGKVPTFVLYILLFIILALICVSGYKVYDYFKAQKEAENSVSHLTELAVTPAPIPETETVQEVQKQEALCPISVDFDALHTENKDIIAWLHLPDTVINYPVLQADDNSYYLHRLTNGYWNIAGSLFLDCRNNATLSDPNSVIYGHNMTNNTMFGTLMDYARQEYYDKHPHMFIITPEKTYRLELLAGFVTDTSSEVYVFPQDEEATASQLAKWLEISDFQTVYEYTQGSRLVTLSTCAEDYGNKRYVVVGALKETKTETE